MSTKLGWALGSWITGRFCDATGYVANVVQNVDVLNGLKAMMSIIPVSIGVVALLILMFLYKLDEPTMKKLRPTWTNGARQAKPARRRRSRSDSKQ